MRRITNHGAATRVCIMHNLGRGTDCIYADGGIWFLVACVSLFVFVTSFSSLCISGLVKLREHSHSYCHDHGRAATARR